MRLTPEYMNRLNNQMADILKSYKDISVAQLNQRFDIDTKAKNGLGMLTARLVSTTWSDIAPAITSKEIVFKTVQLTKYGQLKESMSLPVFDYCGIVKEEWANSTLRKYFWDTVFIFTVYQTVGKEQYLKKLVIWQAPEDILDKDFCEVWTRAKELLLQGKIVKYIDDSDRYHTYFPSLQESPYLHIRPHAQNRADTKPLPVPDKLTGLTRYAKHSFWLNRSFILKVVSRGTAL